MLWLIRGHLCLMSLSTFKMIDQLTVTLSLIDQKLRTWIGVIRNNQNNPQLCLSHLDLNPARSRKVSRTDSVEWGRFSFITCQKESKSNISPTKVWIKIILTSKIIRRKTLTTCNKDNQTTKTTCKRILTYGTRRPRSNLQRNKYGNNQRQEREVQVLPNRWLKSKHPRKYNR